uniref:Antitoxin n=1 Tax=Myoviridae sp. ctjhW4 TaxID=2825162 RepID=A0A8S5PTA9_9CAUD|nr:MAG TPA: antitoxin [Myoviridae sp. ctjhW4]
MGLIDDYANGKITIDEFKKQASEVGVDYEKYSEIIKQYANMV